MKKCFLQQVTKVLRPKWFHSWVCLCSVLNGITFVLVMWAEGYACHTLKLYYLNFKLGHEINHAQLFIWLKLGLSQNVTCCTEEDLSTEHAFRTSANMLPDCSFKPLFFFFFVGGGIDHVPVLSLKASPSVFLKPMPSLATACPLFSFLPNKTCVRFLSSKRSRDAGWGHWVYRVESTCADHFEDCACCTLSPLGGLAWLQHDA